MYQPRGKVLGGTSSINGMVYMRGNAADYDEWRQRGCEGWDYDSVLPYFKRAEDNVRGSDEFHGTGGPLKVSDHRWQPTLAKAMHDAALQAGIPANPDFNGATQEGVGYYQSTINSARRWSSARAYLRGARQRKNLVIATGAHATRVLIENGRATGVEYRTPAGLVRARATREVIVSGGVYGSPQLLMLSGLGPAAHLQQHGVAVIRDMPGVGSHLHDHFNTYVAYRCTQPVTMNDLAISLPRRLMAAAQYALGRTGPLAAMGLFVGALVRSDKRLERPDLQINMFAWATKERTRAGVVPQPFSSFGLSPVHLRPDGRGTVRLKSADPLAPPEIRFNFLKSAYDFQAIIEGMRICREIARQPALQPFVGGEILPGAEVTGEAELRAFIRANGVSNLHPGRHLPHGPRDGCGGRPAAPGPRHRRAARRRRLDHAVDRGRQHQRALDHDRREVRGHGARGRGLRRAETLVAETLVAAGGPPTIGVCLPASANPWKRCRQE